jgi:hypothetical protein
MSRIAIVWLILMAATYASAGIGRAPDWSAGAATEATVAVLLIAILKARLVIYEFMEVRGAPAGLKLVVNAWLIVAFLALVAMWRWGPVLALTDP